MPVLDRGRISKRLPIWLAILLIQIAFADENYQVMSNGCIEKDLTVSGNPDPELKGKRIDDYSILEEGF